MVPIKRNAKNPIEKHPKINLEKIVGLFRGLENLEREHFLVNLKDIIETWPVHEENLSKIAQTVSRYAAHTYLKGAIFQMRQITKKVFDKELGIELTNKDLKALLGGNTQRNLQTIYDSCKSEPPNLSGRFISKGSDLLQ